MQQSVPGYGLADLIRQWWQGPGLFRGEIVEAETGKQAQVESGVGFVRGTRVGGDGKQQLMTARRDRERLCCQVIRPGSAGEFPRTQRQQVGFAPAGRQQGGGGQ